jgi:hypothetical protein
LTKVYGVDAVYASKRLAQMASGPIIISAVDLATALAAMSTADAQGIDLTDALLLQTAPEQGVSRLAQVEEVTCRRICQLLTILFSI